MIVKKLLIFILAMSPMMGAENHREEVTMKNKRVLISGAGIAGFTLAYWLKQRGFSPTIIEKHPNLRGGGYKVDVRGTALEVANRMGIYQDLIDLNVNLKRSKLVTPDFKIFDFEGDILGQCTEGDIEINRWDLVQVLGKAAGEVEIIYNDSITKIDEMVHFERMEPREFDIVVGADGLYSNVRRLVFGEDSQFLRRYGLHFCVFPISNIFGLDRSEIVYFDKGKLVAAYAANHHSYACLAFKSEEKTLPFENLKVVFENQYKGIGWEIPRLISAMNNSDSCYFSSLAQVRMPCWSKGRVVLIGDAAYATQGMGTSLCMVGAYVLAREIDKANGDYSLAFNNYEKAIRSYVEAGQDLAESNQKLMTDEGSSMGMKLKLYLMKILPKSFIQFIAKRGKEEMKKVASSFTLEPIQNRDV